MSFPLTLLVEGTFMEFANSAGSIAPRKYLPNAERQDAVVHQTGTTVAHSVPVRGAANKPRRADRKSDASLCSADTCSGVDLDPHHHAKSGQGSGEGGRARPFRWRT